MQEHAMNVGVLPSFGIVTALPKEFAAVQAMLENGRLLPVGTRGGRQYLLGEVDSLYGGAHSVAVTLLPAMGNSSAAARAALLLERFPSIQHILMVGIAGAAPNPEKPEEHVRLGDIVVSDTTGVIQYDYVAEKMDESVHRAPPRPPSAELLESARLLQAAELSGQRPWLKNLLRVIALPDFSRPSEEQDRLASAPPSVGWIEHPKDTARLDGVPRVFLGPIGSANILLRNPIKRDRMREKFGVKAFEMEGSGVADASWLHDCGYMVIRGTCDYCDGNKNDIWQNYAAAVAAAYARALIAATPVPIGTSELQARNAEKIAAEHLRSFGAQVADIYRLMRYEIEEERVFGARIASLYLVGRLGDGVLRRVVTLAPGGVTPDDIDAIVNTLRSARQELGDVSGTIVTSTQSSADSLARARLEGISVVTLERLQSQVFDGAGYARRLVAEIEADEKYVPNLHVQPRIAVEHTGKPTSADEFIEAWLSDATWNQLTLLGDVGTGKTFLSRMTALRLARDYLDRGLGRPLPVLIDLRNADRMFSLEGLVLSHLQRHGLDSVTFAVFEHALTSGQVVLILDGFDEMAARVTPQVTTRNFQELVKCVRGRAKLLLTCRTHYFRSRADEEEVVLGGKAPNESEESRSLYWDLVTRRGFRIAYLQPFDVPQIEEYVGRARAADAKKALERMRKTYDLMELSRRPMLLDMIVRSIDQLRGGAINPGELYSVFTGAWIQRDRWRDVMSADQKLVLLTSLAGRLWTTGSSRMHYQELLAYIETSGCKIEGASLSEVDNEMRTASFLVRDADGNYGFAHRSYAEFFLAQQIVSSLENGEVGMLSIQPRISTEIAGFVCNLVRNHGQVEARLEQVLVNDYSPGTSENALLCLYRIRRTIGQGGSTERIELSRLPVGMKLDGANLNGVTIDHAVIKDASMCKASLQEATICNCSLEGANFSGGALNGATLQRNALGNATFVGAVVSGLDLTGSDWENANFAGAIGECFDTLRQEELNQALGSKATPQPQRQATLGGDDEYWRSLVFRLEARARRYGFADSDIIQDAILRLIENKERMTVQNDEMFLWFLIRSEARKRHNTEKRQIVDVLGLVESVAEQDVEAEVGAKELLEKVLDELALDERSRRIFLSSLKGDSARAIAVQEDMRPNAVSQVLRTIHDRIFVAAVRVRGGRRANWYSAGASAE